MGSITLFSHVSLVHYFNQLLGSIECQKNKNGFKKVKTHTSTRPESPWLNRNFKLLKHGAQSTQNFTLISKMYNFVYLFCGFFELYSFKGRKRLLPKKRAFSGLKMAMTQKICKKGIQSYTFLKSAWKSASIGKPCVGIWAASNFCVVGVSRQRSTPCASSGIYEYW